mmetsp:Transcript_34551/g.104198  ORF Transcript_34551/g.104198 Transcript_34551/m.104198 type:complete len:242 (+) Transcript_34551:138-863(+)
MHRCGLGGPLTSGHGISHRHTFDRVGRCRESWTLAQSWYGRRGGDHTVTRRERSPWHATRTTTTMPLDVATQSSHSFDAVDWSVVVVSLTFLLAIEPVQKLCNVALCQRLFLSSAMLPPTPSDGVMWRAKQAATARATMHALEVVTAILRLAGVCAALIRQPGWHRSGALTAASTTLQSLHLHLRPTTCTTPQSTRCITRTFSRTRTSSQRGSAKMRDQSHCRVVEVICGQHLVCALLSRT